MIKKRLSKKKEETAVPKQKIVKKNFEEKIIKKRKPIDTIIELHHGLKKLIQILKALLMTLKN